MGGVPVAGQGRVYWAFHRFLTYPSRRTRRTIWKIKKRIYRPALGVPAAVHDAHKYRLVKLGTAYGGWTFVDSDDLNAATVISCGLGTDASFDVEFAARYQGRVIVVDPTPNAILHFAHIMARVGKPATTAYCQKGNQVAEAYDLSAVGAANLELVPQALWSESKTMRFYAPPGDGVSYSLGNFLNGYRTDTPYIEVDAVPLDALMRRLGLAGIPLLKLDIEGAEIEVVQDLMAKQIYPRQILIEYDELSRPSAHTKQRIESAHRALRANGYTLIHDDGKMNFLYMRE